MSETSLAVEIRESTGKGAARKLRATARCPAVLYGHSDKSVSLVVDPKALEALIRSSHAGLNTLIDLEGAAEVAGKTVMVKELQREPVRGELLHADFYEIDKSETMTVSVPVHLVGQAKGVVMGGLVDHALREVELSCLVTAIPDQIDVDVSDLDLGDSVHAGDLVLPGGVELKTDPELSIVSIVSPAAEEEVADVSEEVEEVESDEPVAPSEAKED